MSPNHREKIQGISPSALMLYSPFYFMDGPVKFISFKDRILTITFCVRSIKITVLHNRHLFGNSPSTIPSS